MSNFGQQVFAAKEGCNIGIFQLSIADNILRTLDPRIKVGGLTALSLMITITGWKGLLVSSLMLLGLVAWSRTPLKIYRSILAVLLWIGLFYAFAAGWVWPENKAFWYGHWSRSGLIQASIMIWRIALLFGLTRLFAAVTMPLEQGLGIAYFFNPLIKITPKAADFALLLTLTLRFIPLILEEASLIWKARILKGDWKEAPWHQRSRDFVKLIVPLLLLSLRRAEELADNMVARGYGSGDYQTLIFHEQSFKDRIGILLIIIWGIVLWLLR